MKIEGLGKVTPTTRSKRKEGAKDSAFADALETSSETEAKAPAKAPAPVAGIDALLSMQSVDDAASGRSAGLAQARSMLDGLEAIRRGLLAGVIPAAQIKAVLRSVEARRGAILDPQLSEILDEIELRARVELAKLGIQA